MSHRLETSEPPCGIDGTGEGGSVAVRGAQAATRGHSGQLQPPPNTVWCYICRRHEPIVRCEDCGADLRNPHALIKVCAAARQSAAQPETSRTAQPRKGTHHETTTHHRGARRGGSGAGRTGTRRSAVIPSRPVRTGCVHAAGAKPSHSGWVLGVHGLTKREATERHNGSLRLGRRVGTGLHRSRAAQSVPRYAGTLTPTRCGLANVSTETKWFISLNSTAAIDDNAGRAVRAWL